MQGVLWIPRWLVLCAGIYALRQRVIDGNATGRNRRVKQKSRHRVGDAVQLTRRPAVLFRPLPQLEDRRLVASILEKIFATGQPP